MILNENNEMIKSIVCIFLMYVKSLYTFKKEHAYKRALGQER